MFAKLIMSLFASIISESKKSLREPPLKNTEPTLKEEDGYYKWDKGQDFALSPYFTTREFTCHCNFPDCVKQRISKTLIVRLDLIRKEVKQPLVITSGFRCHAHQAFLRSAGVSTVVAKASTHELGDAADAVPKDGNIATFLPIAEKHFDSIGLSKSFLHLDLRIGKRRWDY